MTDRLYYNDSYLREFEARIVQCGKREDSLNCPRCDGEEGLRARALTVGEAEDSYPL